MREMMRCGGIVGIHTPVILSILLSGCGLMMIGPPAEKIDVDSGSNEQKNLEAVRAMQADQAGHAASGASTGQESSPCAPDGVGKNRCADR
ncbi:protein of unknown function [Nitrospira japonica]|uniref:Lipoprotein n=1 Tax=Nitrospira japonica TaxID=1325564 RepID=A0A1W1I7H0_9BACT|nr:hypothetical protein [Nitrospira japonica]SLM48957.1 protein of unknown function [Nitrospira japonica]